MRSRYRPIRYQHPHTWVQGRLHFPPAPVRFSELHHQVIVAAPSPARSNRVMRTALEELERMGVRPDTWEPLVLETSLYFPPARGGGAEPRAAA